MLAPHAVQGVRLRTAVRLEWPPESPVQEAASKARDTGRVPGGREIGTDWRLHQGRRLAASRNHLDIVQRMWAGPGSDGCHAGLWLGARRARNVLSGAGGSQALGSAARAIGGRMGSGWDKRTGRLQS